MPNGNVLRQIGRGPQPSEPPGRGFVSLGSTNAEGKVEVGATVVGGVGTTVVVGTAGELTVVGLVRTLLMVEPGITAADAETEKPSIRAVAKAYLRETNMNKAPGLSEIIVNVVGVREKRTTLHDTIWLSENIHHTPHLCQTLSGNFACYMLRFRDIFPKETCISWSDKRIESCQTSRRDVRIVAMLPDFVK